MPVVAVVFRPEYDSAPDAEPASPVDRTAETMDRLCRPFTAEPDARTAVTCGG